MTPDAKTVAHLIRDLYEWHDGIERALMRDAYKKAELDDVICAKAEQLIARVAVLSQFQATALAQAKKLAVDLLRRRIVEIPPHRVVKRKTPTPKIDDPMLRIGEVVASLTLQVRVTAEAIRMFIPAPPLRRKLVKVLKIAKADMKLALQQEKTAKGLQLRLLDSAVQSARDYVSAVDNGLVLPGYEFLGLVRQRPISDETALTIWSMGMCPAIRSMTDTLKARSGHHDFPQVLTDVSGRVLGKNGKPLQFVEKTDENGKVIGWERDGEYATSLDRLTPQELLVLERRKATDWIYMAERLIEIVDEATAHSPPFKKSAKPPDTIPIEAKPHPRGRKKKFNDPDEDRILNTYLEIRNTKQTVEVLKLQPIGRISALRRIKLIVNRYRAKVCRDKRKQA